MLYPHTPPQVADNAVGTASSTHQEPRKKLESECVCVQMCEYVSARVASVNVDMKTVLAYDEGGIRKL